MLENLYFHYFNEQKVTKHAFFNEHEWITVAVPDHASKCVFQKLCLTEMLRRVTYLETD